MSASPQTIYIESSRAKLTLCRKSIEKFDEMHFLFSSPSDCSTCPRETERTQTDGPGLTRVESAGLRLAASLSYGEGEWARGVHATPQLLVSHRDGLEARRPEPPRCRCRQDNRHFVLTRL